MKSMEVLLSETLGAMSEKQKAAFFEKRQKGMPIEGQVSLAKECLAQESFGQPIKRNNGASSYVEESEFSESKSEQMLAELMELSRPQAFKGSVALKEVSALTESQKKEFEFCRLLGMSEADSLKSAKSDVQD